MWRHTFIITLWRPVEKLYIGQGRLFRYMSQGGVYIESRLRQALRDKGGSFKIRRNIIAS